MRVYSARVLLVGAVQLAASSFGGDWFTILCIE
jgi:hypothetical protein